VTPFRTWSVAAAVSSLGDSVTYFAIGWTAAAHAPEAASLVLTLESVPLCVLILLGGAVADRWGIRRTMLCCDAAMVLVLVAFLLAQTAGGASVLSLSLLALAAGTAAALRRPADGAFPRLFAGNEELSRALASVSLLQQVARTSGPALGGLLLGLGGLPLTTGLDAASYLLVLAVLLRVRPPREEPPSSRERVTAGIRASLGAARTQGVVPLLTAVTLLGGSVLPTVILCVPLAGLERGWGAAATGAVAGCWTVGTFAVTWAVSRWGDLRARARVVGPGLGTAGVLLLAVTSSVPAGAAGLVLLGLGTSAYTTAALPLFVRATPAGMLARFQALLGFAQNLAVMLALPALGWIAAEAGVRTALAVVAVLLLGSAALPLPDRDGGDLLTRSAGPVVRESRQRRPSTARRQQGARTADRDRTAPSSASRPAGRRCSRSTRTAADSDGASHGSSARQLASPVLPGRQATSCHSRWAFGNGPR